jgi:hypothetical protein
VVSTLTPLPPRLAGEGQGVGPNTLSRS